MYRGYSQDVIWCKLIGSLKSVDKVGLTACQLNLQAYRLPTIELTSIPKVGMRVRIWKNLQKVKNKPATIVAIELL